MAIAQSTTLKAEIITALDSLSLEHLQAVLAHVQQLQPQKKEHESERGLDAVPEKCRPEVWAAYLASERERTEVYRRLTDS